MKKEKRKTDKCVAVKTEERDQEKAEKIKEKK